MPLYEYGCQRCGAFEARAGVATAGLDVDCPSCGAPARRVLSAPGGRTPRRSRLLGGVGAAGLGRVERAEAGAASVGGLPAGARVDGAGRPLPARAAGAERRPWQLGH